LLRLAHDSIVSALEPSKADREISLDSPSAHLAQPRGVFTSLHLGGELRGCVGYVLPIAPLYRAVAETARAAAFDDTRFYPVTAEEAPHLEIELSILSVPKPIHPEAVEVGRHGLVISVAGHRGLLLPQVPVEQQWDRTTFLEQTCRKAGLPLDAWQKGATIEAFTAEVFGEERARD
jgi:AmmeMemoRadiSam system protein A